MSLWGYGFNRESTGSKFKRRYGAFYLSSMFILPPLIYYFFGNPIVTGWFIKEVIPVEYPPESDPKIISRAYKGRGDSKGQAF